jgi:transaldolase/glucose-6-phosphate isomerase
MKKPSTDAGDTARAPGETRETGSRIKALQQFGQSVWLDDLGRSFFTSGEFQRLIDEDGLRGATSNPSIFEKAMVESGDYRSALEELQRRGDMKPMALYEALAMRDIRDAADLLRPAYVSTGRADGFVSLEVSPYLAHDTEKTIDEARRLFKAVGRENVMIKVPASIEGLPAIRQLTSEGINVNITLLFGIERYEAVARAYFGGLADFVRNGGDPGRVNSVASFFVSRIDTMVDGIIVDRLAATSDASVRAALTGLLGTIAIANAKLAYQRYLALCRTPEWERLAAAGAHPQRLLWASTSTKNPEYSDVRYIEELIGRDTVTTVTTATLKAFRDHGRLRASLESDVDKAREQLEALAPLGISLTDVTDRLLEDGVMRFSKSFDTLLTTLGGARAAGAPARAHSQPV